MTQYCFKLTRLSSWLSLVAICMSASLYADTSVWVASSGGDMVYLGGTVHLLRPTDYPLPEEFEQAYQDSSEIYFETDINSMTDLSVQAQMLQQLMYNDERTLQTVLNEEAYSALSRYTAATGLPMVMIEKFKPGMDAYFNTRALGDAKTLGELETVQQQIGFLAAMGEGYESEFILMSLREMGEIESMMEVMITAWRSGDTETLSELFVADMQAQSPELYDALLAGRNDKWLPQIEQMFRDRETEFVLVGAAHLVGERGLLNMLESRGYEVRKL
jgi:uncharacterized protein YbaP (TraB family)